MFQHADETRLQFEALVGGAWPSGSQMRAEIAAGRTRDLLSIDSAGSVFVLIRTRERSMRRLPRSYEALRIAPPSAYSVEIAGHVEDHHYVAVELVNGRPELLASFSLLAAALLAVLPDLPSPNEVDDFVDAFVEMFSSPAVPDRSVVKGIWGELWVLASAPNPSLMVEAWHPSATARFDFSLERGNLEVKTHEGERAIHHFSHLQLTTSPGTTTIVSVRVFADASGKSIIELVQLISLSLNVSEKSMLLRKVFGVLGSGLETVEEHRYKTDSSVKLSCISAEKIPTVSVPRNVPISEIHYVVDITEILPTHGRRLADLFLSLLPELR